jgi:hypothetical protein
MQERIQAVLESGRYILGEEGTSFEAEFARRRAIRFRRERPASQQVVEPRLAAR